jgi:hypothetical protein
MAGYLNDIEKDRASIERWEGEGGRALAVEESPSARSGDFARSDLEDRMSFDAPSQPRLPRERGTRSP